MLINETNITYERQVAVNLKYYSSDRRATQNMSARRSLPTIVLGNMKYSFRGICLPCYALIAHEISTQFFNEI